MPFNSPPQNYVYITYSLAQQSFIPKMGCKKSVGFARDIFLHSKNMIYCAPQANLSNAI